MSNTRSASTLILHILQVSVRRSLFWNLCGFYSRSNVPTPAPECLDDFRGHRSCKRHSKDDQRLVDAVCKEKLCPYTYQTRLARPCSATYVQFTTLTRILPDLVTLDIGRQSFLRIVLDLLHDRIVLRLHTWYDSTNDAPESAYDGMLDLSYSIRSHQSHGQEAEREVERRQTKVNTDSRPSILAR